VSETSIPTRWCRAACGLNLRRRRRFRQLEQLAADPGNSGGIEANWAVIPSTDSTGLRRGAERNQIAHAPECFLRGLLLYPLLTFTDPERFPGDTENAHNDFYPRTFVRNAADTLGAGMAGGKAFLGSNLDRLGI
jgi:hypothetical protein